MVAVTGDGNNDALALRTGDVGFAMGTGCEVAKDSSGMILLNDDFGATIHAVMWGRNIYNNIRKFLMFQITASLSCLVIVLLGTSTMGKSPLNTPQLLWLNVIIDALAALALATEPPHVSVLKLKPFKRNEDMLNKVMWRQIIGIGMY